MNQRQIYNMDLDHILFLTGFFIVLSRDLLVRLSCAALITDSKVELLGYSLLVAKIIYDTYNHKITKKLLIYVLMILSGMMTYWLSGQDNLLKLAIILLSAAGVCYRRILSMYVSTVGSLFFTNLLMVAAGVKEQSVVFRAHEGHRAMGRYSLGTWGCNMPLILCIYLFFAIVLLYQERLNIYFYLISILVAGIIYYFTDQRGAMIIFIISTALFLLIRNQKIEQLIKNQVVLGLYVLYMIIALTAGLVVDGKRFTENIFVNTFVSRLMAFGVCRRSLGFSLFGKSFDGLNFPVDILFYNVLFSCGIVGLVLVSLVIARAILCEDNNADILVVLIGNILLWVFEATIFSPLYISALFVAVANLKNEETGVLVKSKECIDRLIDEDSQRRFFLVMQAGVLAMFVGHTLWIWLQTKGIGNNLRMGVVSLATAMVGVMLACGILWIRIIFESSDMKGK